MFLHPQRCDLSMFDLVGLESRVSRYQADVFLPRHKVSRQLIQEIVESPEPPPRPKPVRMKVNRYTASMTFKTTSYADKLLPQRNTALPAPVCQLCILSSVTVGATCVKCFAKGHLTDNSIKLKFKADQHLAADKSLSGLFMFFCP